MGRHLPIDAVHCAAKRWADLQRDQRVAIVMDDGSDFSELCDVEILGSVDFVREQPPVMSASLLIVRQCGKGWSWAGGRVWTVMCMPADGRRVTW